VDGSGNVYVTGSSYGYDFDYTTIKYNSSGIQQWISKYNGPGNSSDVANSIVVDGSGNVYVTGYSAGIGIGNDYTTIKYNSSGDSVWVRRYNGPGNSDDRANSIIVDGSGNVYVTGYSRGGGTGDDYTTIKYNSSGDSVWVRRFSSTGNSSDVANSIVVDVSGNVYVTGYSVGIGTASDYTTIKYNSTGDSLWVRRYNGPGKSLDVANSIVVDDSGNVYVTGYSYGTENDYITIKYNSSGDSVWVERYNGTGNSSDVANSIVVDVSGNVYVTGNSVGIGTGNDYATIKYSKSVGINQISTEIPETFSLSQNYPNPFNPNTKIKFEISQKSFVKVYVYNILGELIADLVNEQLQPGVYETVFDGNLLTSGIYFYRLETETFSETRKMLLIK